MAELYENDELQERVILVGVSMQDEDDTEAVSYTHLGQDAGYEKGYPLL